MRPKFRIDFFLIPDNFDKICEGFYIDTEKETVDIKRNEDGDEVL